MRLEARVLEGDETRKVLVPLCTLLAFKQENDGKGVNHFINCEFAQDFRRQKGGE